MLAEVLSSFPEWLNLAASRPDFVRYLHVNSHTSSHQSKEYVPPFAPPCRLLFSGRKHARIYGFTAAEARAATVLQNHWRGKAARNHFQLLMRAQRICK